MKLIAVTSLLLIALPTFAGTLRDDFNDGDIEGWQPTFAKNPENSIWEVVKGVLIGRRVSGWAADLVVGDATWKDYTIEFDMRVTERLANEFGGRYHYAGVIGRLRVENGIEIDALGFNLNFKVPPTIWSWGWRNQAFLHDVQTPFDAELGTWYHMRAIFEGDKFECYIDGKRVASYASSVLPTGLVGLSVGGCVAEFDNVVITGDDVPDMNLSVEPTGKLATTWGRVKGE